MKSELEVEREDRQRKRQLLQRQEERQQIPSLGSIAIGS